MYATTLIAAKNPVMEISPIDNHDMGMTAKSNKVKIAQAITKSNLRRLPLKKTKKSPASIARAASNHGKTVAMPV